MSLELPGTVAPQPPMPPQLPDEPLERVGESIEGLRPLAQDFNPADLNGSFSGLGEELAYALPRAAMGAAATVNLLAAPLVGALGRDAQDKWFAAMVDPQLRTLDEIDQRTMTNGVAARVIGQLARVAVEAPLGPVGVGALEAGTRTGRELFEGETAGHASALGSISGGTMAVGFALPLSLPVKEGFGPALLQRIGYGVGSNVVLGAAQRGGEKALGEDVEVLDRTALALDASLGVLFGGGAHLYLRRSDADAAMTVVEQASAQRAVPPGTQSQAALDHLAARAKAEQTGETPPADPPVPHALAARIDDEAGRDAEAFAETEPALAAAESLAHEATAMSELRAWSEGSKVVDGAGAPLPVYRGTPRGNATGKFFTANPEMASGYAQSSFHRGGAEPTVHKAYLSMKNPLVIDALGKRNDNIPVPWTEWKPKVFGNLPKNAVSVDAALKYALEHGHDGLIVRNVVDTADIHDRTKGDVYAVADESQVRSAFVGTGQPIPLPGGAVNQGAHPFAGFTKEQFLGEPTITRESNADQLRPKAISSVEKAASEPFAVGEGLTARYSEDGAAVFDGDTVVASYNFGDTLVVDKAYRRNGIAEELVYQWRTRNPNAPPAKARTKKAQAVQEKVWARIERERGRPPAEKRPEVVKGKAVKPEWKPVNDDGDEVDIDLPTLQQAAAQLDALGAKAEDGRTYGDILKQAASSKADAAALLDNVTQCVLNYGH